MNITTLPQKHGKIPISTDPSMFRTLTSALNPLVDILQLFIRAKAIGEAKNLFTTFITNLKGVGGNCQVMLHHAFMELSGVSEAITGEFHELIVTTLNDQGFALCWLSAYSLMEIIVTRNFFSVPEGFRKTLKAIPAQLNSFVVPTWGEEKELSLTTLLAFLHQKPTEQLPLCNPATTFHQARKKIVAPQNKNHLFTSYSTPEPTTRISKDMTINNSMSKKNIEMDGLFVDCTEILTIIDSPNIAQISVVAGVNVTLILHSPVNSQPYMKLYSCVSNDDIRVRDVSFYSKT